MGTVAEDGDPETRACCSRHIGRPGSAGPKIDARSWAAGETSSRISGAATGSNFSGPGPVEPLEATEARLVGRRCQGEANRKARLQALTARAQASSQHLLRPTLQNLLSSSSSTTPPPQTTSLGLSRPSVTPLGGRLLTLNHQGQSPLCKPWPSRLPARPSRCRSALQHPTLHSPCTASRAFPFNANFVTRSRVCCQPLPASLSISLCRAGAALLPRRHADADRSKQAETSWPGLSPAIQPYLHQQHHTPPTSTLTTLHHSTSRQAHNIETSFNPISRTAFKLCFHTSV
jgi:hypothetical protein